jgi:hypothetical protein
MKYLNLLLLAAIFATSAPLVASAQPTLPQRCNNDALVGAPAEARVHWTRRCAFRHRVGNPNFWFDSGIPAANGGTLKDYLEYDPNFNFNGQNSWIGPSGGFEINLSVISLLFLSGATSQFVDGPGYYNWERAANRKRLRPIYPIFGSSWDLNTPANEQLFPHPTNPDDCSFYLNKLGTVPATGRSFYLNAYCEPSGPLLAADGSSSEDSFAPDELEELARRQAEEVSLLNRLARYKALPADPILR